MRVTSTIIYTMLVVLLLIGASAASAAFSTQYSFKHHTLGVDVEVVQQSVNTPFLFTFVLPSYVNALESQNLGPVACSPAAIVDANSGSMFSAMECTRNSSVEDTHLNNLTNNLGFGNFGSNNRFQSDSNRSLVNAVHSIVIDAPPPTLSTPVSLIFNSSTTSVPEPDALALIALGLLIIGWVGRKSRSFG